MTLDQLLLNSFIAFYGSFMNTNNNICFRHSWHVASTQKPNLQKSTRKFHFVTWTLLCLDSRDPQSTYSRRCCSLENYRKKSEQRTKAYVAQHSSQKSSPPANRCYSSEISHNSAYNYPLSPLLLAPRFHLPVRRTPQQRKTRETRSNWQNVSVQITEGRFFPMALVRDTRGGRWMGGWVSWNGVIEA